MQDFRKLKVWQKSQALCTRLDRFEKRIALEKPSLADQIDRAAGSIPANISEGCGRETRPDFRRFLTMAIGSASELENHLLRAVNARMITQSESVPLIESTIEIRKMLHGLRKSLGG
ncbi:MAG TPA: four helix bundle protein [Gemmatimonadaceae bacterium]|nr:four helix bundle protein [Gemmatimonadaceae bacterium]